MVTNQRGVFIISERCQAFFPDTKRPERKSRQEEIPHGIIKEKNRRHCYPNVNRRGKQSARLRYPKESLNVRITSLCRFDFEN